MKSHQEAPSRVTWVFAGILTMVADIAGTLAQFLPMKSVFILAADDIPSFFPQPLIEAGPIPTALALVVVAAAMAIFSKVTKNFVAHLSSPSQTIPQRESLLERQPITGDKKLLTLKEFSSLILIVVLLGVSVGVSVTFTLTVVCWIAGSAAVIAIRVHRGERKPPYPNGRVEFNIVFKKWMTDSALWAVVGAAIATLVVAFPPLGLTGILLGAVLLRRAQQAFPDVVPWVIARFSPVNNSGASHHELSRPILAPYDFVATRPGARLLRSSLKALNYDPSTWQVCALPNNVQMTIACKSLETGTIDLIRLFAPNSERAREHEWALRHDFRDFLPSHVESMRLETVAEMPAIVLKFADEHQPVLEQRVTAQEAMDWQLDWEVSCATSELAQQVLASYDVPDPRDFLYPLLLTASRINGPHTASVGLLLEKFDYLRTLYLDSPKVLSAGGPISAPNLIRLSSKEPVLMNLSTWRVGLVGTEWRDSPAWLSEFEKRVRPEPTARLADGSGVRNYVHILARGLQSRDAGRVGPGAEALNVMLR